MEELTKVETAATLSAVRAVIESGVSSGNVLHVDHPLRASARKLEENLKEFNAR